LADEDYKQTLAHADEYQRSLYEEEARAIDGIQRGILEVSVKEEPFDIFICYKEADDINRRTPDSVLAQDMYHQLTNEGFKVFFARITLEDKLGSAYEPYIFAALQSSRIMIVLGTKTEYFNAVWVKNEWNRYLALIKGGAKKVLIPAYRDMDPYNLPEEFSHLQAQDMSKLGFMQDLIRGTKKIFSSEVKEPTPTVKVANNLIDANVSALFLRASIELEDGNWQKADDLFEQTLNSDPKNSQAYIGKLCAALELKEESLLKDNITFLTEYSDFNRALRFANKSYKTVLEGYNKAIFDNIENARKQVLYDEAIKSFNSLKNMYESLYFLTSAASKYMVVSEMFKGISGFADADELTVECERLSVECSEKAVILEEQENQQKEQRELREKQREEEQQRIEMRNFKIGFFSFISFIAILVCYALIINVIIPCFN
jgi:tetratricopeptide (TPR) repeat protein